jgi:hypothetical protein
VNSTASAETRVRRRDELFMSMLMVRLGLHSGQLALRCPAAVYTRSGCPYASLRVVDALLFAVWVGNQVARKWLRPSETRTLTEVVSRVFTVGGVTKEVYQPLTFAYPEIKEGEQDLPGILPRPTLWRSTDCGRGHSVDMWLACRPCTARAQQVMWRIGWDASRSG